MYKPTEEEKATLFKLIDEATNDELHEFMIDNLKIPPDTLTSLSYLPADEWKQSFINCLHAVVDGDFDKAIEGIMQDSLKGLAIKGLHEVKN